MDTHKNALLTPRGREAMARSVIEGGLSKAAAARQFNTTPKTVAKWVARFRARAWPVCGIARPGRIHRQAKRRQPNAPPSKVCEGSATPASRSPRKSGFRPPRQPHPEAAGPQSAFRSRAGRAGPSLRTRNSRRDPPHRHQEARQIQSHWPPHHRRSHWPEQDPRDRLGICASGDRRSLPARLFGNPAGRDASLLPALSSSTPYASFEASASRSSAS